MQSEQPETIRAAGLMMVNDGKVLLCKRADTGEWAFPGGHIEADESANDAAVREAGEETGWEPLGERAQFARRIKDGVDFTTFRQDVDAFEPKLCAEHTEHVWADAANYPEPLHPGVKTVLSMIDANELDIARLIRDGELTSPQVFHNVTLYAIRITGTGVAYRSADDEFVWRNPDDYLNEEFLARCNGLPVIFQHPEERLLNSEEYADRNIGSSFLPYIKDDEVWTIAKIYDDASLSLMSDEQLSTSPGVLATGPTIELEDGSKLMIESKPRLLDHIAVCGQGVWDKAASPSGVLSENLGDQNMADDKAEADKKADGEDMEMDSKKADADPMKALCDSVASIAARMDAMDKERADAKMDAEDDDKEEKKADEAEDEKSEEKKADEDEDDKEEKKMDKKADAKADADIRRSIADLDRRIPKILSDADMNAIADAQARADSVAAAFGSSAPRPVAGETPRAYRGRLAGAFKKHSPDWKDIDLAKADDALLTIAEKAIYADAERVAGQPAMVPAGQLRETIRLDDAGRRVKTYTGAPDSWMRAFKPPRRRAIKFNERAGV